MKNLIFVITIIFSVNVYAQNPNDTVRTEIQNTNAFVRVYDLQGKKISKGNILSVSETSLQLDNYDIIPVSSIGFIKTKHSAGNNVLVGTLLLAAPVAILGAMTADPDAWIYAYSAADGAAGGALLGGIAGAAIGGISILFKNSQTYIINGNKELWQSFKESIIK